MWQERKASLVRIVGTVALGVVLGIALPFWIGYLGLILGDGPPRVVAKVSMSGADESPEATAALAPDRTPFAQDSPAREAPGQDAPAQDAPGQGAPPRRGLPAPFYLWRDGYPTGPRLDRWDAANLEALAAYVADWGLTPPILDADGAPVIEPDLADRLLRTHPETRPQWIAAGPDGCMVWIAAPEPRMTAEWFGPCRDGLAVGEGRLALTFLFQGQTRTRGYDGPMLAGRADGAGLTLLKRGHRYEGMHKAGLFDGPGTLFWPDGDSVFEGRFAAGFPDGPGMLSGPGTGAAPDIRGVWDLGCLQGVPEIAVLRHPIECGAGGAADLSRLVIGAPE